MTHELLKSSRSVALVLPKNLTDEIVGAALALFLFFKQNNRVVGIFSDSILPHQWKCLDCSPMHASAPHALTEHTLVIDTLKHPIKEIRYEKDDEKNRLRIVVALPEGSRIKREDITVESSEPTYESIVTVGAKNVASVGSVWRMRPDLFYEKPLITVHPETDQETVAEKAALLMKRLSPQPYTPAIATALLFSLLAETDNLKKSSAAATPRAHELASELIAHDADHRRIAEFFTEKPSVRVLQLWGRACARSKMDATLPVFWSVLTSDDFAVTNTTPDALPAIMRQMETHAPAVSASVFLWQHPIKKTVSCSVVSKNKTVSERLNIQDEYPTFPAAEAHIRSLLREVL